MKTKEKILQIAKVMWYNITHLNYWFIHWKVMFFETIHSYLNPYIISNKEIRENIKNEREIYVSFVDLQKNAERFIYFVVSKEGITIEFEEPKENLLKGMDYLNAKLDNTVLTEFETKIKFDDVEYYKTFLDFINELRYVVKEQIKQLERNEKNN